MTTLSKDASLDTLIESQEDEVVYLQNAFDKIVSSEAMDVVSQFMEDQNTLSTAYAMMSHLGQMSNRLLEIVTYTKEQLDMPS